MFCNDSLVCSLKVWNRATTKLYSSTSTTQLHSPKQLPLISLPASSVTQRELSSLLLVRLPPFSCHSAILPTSLSASTPPLSPFLHSPTSIFFLSLSSVIQYSLCTAYHQPIRFAVTGDIMGPSISGLDKLIKMPYGCGEQNMLNFAPTIFVTEYLEKAGQLSSALKAKSVGFMEKGWLTH